MKKTGRNDPCVCGSGKKFKKCCESKMIGGRFMATKVDTEASSQIKKTVGMTSFFQNHLALTPKKPLPPVQEQTIPAVVEENLAEKEKIC
jgi:hypothetical protein